MERTKNTFFLARHGATTYNDQQIFMGRLDISLNANGREQARLLGQELKDKAIDLIYSSPLLRAKETAVIAMGQMERPLPVFETSEALMERSLGELEGRHKKKYRQELPFYKGKSILYDYDLVPAGGESYAGVAARIGSFLEFLDGEWSGKRILLITHHGPLRVILTKFWGMGWVETYPVAKPLCRLIAGT
ncbi:MAG: histidine phosphatase family protein [Bacteroidia bacterium]|nr:histidine phosphatase family protein [Bacteroidia bacterium]